MAVSLQTGSFVAMEGFLKNVRGSAPEYSPLHDMRDDDILNSKRCVRGDGQGADDGVVSLYVRYVFSSSL